MPRPVAVHALPNYRIRLRYDDGVEGVADLTDLAGKGVFAAWDQPGAFEAVTIGPGDSIAWSEEIELCPDSLYLEVTGQRAEDLWPGLAATSARA